MKKSESVLKSLKVKIVVKIEKNYEPKKFFTNRDGLYIWSGFKDNVLEKAKSTTLTSYNISSFNLMEISYDREIEKELPKKHLFTETELCAVISGLLEKQSKGEVGSLLNNGYANIFYTRSRVVYVFWYSGHGEWDVDDWDRDDDSWHGGHRVFSPATEA